MIYGLKIKQCSNPRKRTVISVIAQKNLEKNLGFDGIRTQASQMIVGRYYQLSFKATCWERGTFWRVRLSSGEIRSQFLIK